MKKINNKGFMIAELLIVTIAIMVIFTVIYSNFYPTIGEYEKREEYININATYANFYLKLYTLKYLNNNQTIETNFLDNINNNSYITFVTNSACTSINTAECNSLVSNLEIQEAILTTDNLTMVKENYPISGVLKNYINYLSSSSNDNGLYRLIIKTSNGYANSTFYSKKCNSTKEDWYKLVDDWNSMIPTNYIDNDPLWEKEMRKVVEESWSNLDCTNFCQSQPHIGSCSCNSIDGYMVNTGGTITYEANCNSETSTCNAMTIYKVSGNPAFKSCPDGYNCRDQYFYQTYSRCDINEAKTEQTCTTENGCCKKIGNENIEDKNSPYVSPCN